MQFYFLKFDSIDQVRLGSPQLIKIIHQNRQNYNLTYYPQDVY